MTDPQLNVEYEELMARAAELDEPMPDIPSDPLTPPSLIRMTVVSAEQLKLSADNMRLYLRKGEQEWGRLAESLRKAAKAYQQTEEAAADAVSEGIAVEPVLPAPVDDIDVSDLAPTPSASGGAHATGQYRHGRLSDGTVVGVGDWLEDGPEYFRADPNEFPDGGCDEYYEVRQAATDMEEPDQGAGYKAFAQSWDDFQRALQNMVSRFRSFEYWEGEAREIVESDFEQQRAWIYQMAGLCSTLARQATGVADAQRYGYQNHPTSYDVAIIDADYALYAYPGHESPVKINWCLQRYYECQQHSEDVLAQYASRGSLPLAPVNPVKPPTRTAIDLPRDETDIPDIPGLDPGSSGLDDGLGDLEDALSGLNLPSTNGQNPDTGALADALTSAMATDPHSGFAEPSVKAAGVGGGGSMPLKPPIDHGVTAGQGVSSASTGAAPGAGAAHGAGAGRGGMGGMGPMGGGGQGQQGAKAGKRAQKDDEALYYEERPWTEPVIGNRRRADPPVAKESG